jgi:hypothetical protein
MITNLNINAISDGSIPASKLQDAYISKTNTTPPNDEIWYTSTDGDIVSISSSVTTFGVSIVSNTYDNGKGVIKCSGAIKYIGQSVFGDQTTLKSIIIPDSVGSIKASAFHDCISLSSVTIGVSVGEIEYGAFFYCRSLSSVTIPDRVTSIGSHAFLNCDSLKSVTIGKGVSTIGEGAFSSCTVLTDIFMTSAPPEIYGIFDSSVPTTLTIWVPTERLQSYNDDIEWSNYADNIKAYNIKEYISESLVPSSDYMYTLGTDSKRWGPVYSTQFVGDLVGSASKVQLTGGTITGSEPMLYLVGATEQGAPGEVHKNVELNTLGMLSGNVARWGVAYESASSSLIIGDLTKGSAGLSNSYLTLGSDMIRTNGNLNIQGYGGVSINDAANMGDIELSSLSGVNIVVGDEGGSQGIINVTPGVVRVDGSFNCSGNFEVNTSGNCYAFAFYETSDENLKDFTDDITIDFNKLKEIRKSYFTWKDGDQNLHIGTSAQDIQKIYPELVSEDDKGNLTVDYAKLSIIALSAIDKLDERLSRIENILNKEE